jgi:hypothetical protein
MSRVIRFHQFLPVERSKFLAALEGAGLDAGRFHVSKMEISPPLMPGNVTALVTVRLATGVIAFSYEDSCAASWVGAFGEDLRAGHFGGAGASDGQSTPQPGLEQAGQA